MFSVRKRRALLLPSGPPGSDIKHLFVILNDPAGSRGEVVLVPISSVRPERKYDDACLIEKGEHAFIKHRSYAVYKLCEQRDAAELERGVRNGRFTDKGFVSEELFARIVRGVARSKLTRSFVHPYLSPP